MGHKEELLVRLKNNPVGASFEDLDKLLRWYGYECRHTGGSHYFYKRQGCSPLTVPRHKPLKQVYVKKAIAALESCLDVQGE